MTDSIKYAESKIEFFKDAFAKTDDRYYFEQAQNWIAHRADLVNENK